MLTSDTRNDHQLRREAESCLPRVLFEIVDDYLGAHDCRFCGKRSLCVRGFIIANTSTEHRPRPSKGLYSYKWASMCDEQFMRDRTNMMMKLLKGWNICFIGHNDFKHSNPAISNLRTKYFKDAPYEFRASICRFLTLEFIKIRATKMEALKEEEEKPMTNKQKQKAINKEKKRIKGHLKTISKINYCVDTYFLAKSKTR